MQANSSSSSRRPRASQSRGGKEGGQERVVVRMVLVGPDELDNVVSR